MNFKFLRSAAGAALVIGFTVSAAQAGTAPSAFYVNLDTANGGTLDNNPAFLAGSIIANADSTLTLSDTNYLSPAVTVAGPAFKFVYSFHLGTADGASSYVFQGTENGIDTASFALKLVDSTTKTTVTSGVIDDYGQLNLSASGLNASDKYKIIVTGALTPGSTSGSFNGGVNPVSAVPLPGALILFGSSLLGLGGLSRRRRQIAAAAGALAAVAVAGTAQAASTTNYQEVVNLGQLPVATVNEHVVLNGADIVASNGKQTVSASGNYTGEVSQKGTLKTTTGNNLPAAIYEYDFTIKAPQKLDMKFGGSSTLNLVPGDFVLEDVTTGTTFLPKAGTLEIVAWLSNVKDKYAYFVTLPSAGKGGSFSGTATVSAVPVPAALPMFGAALIGLGGLARRRAKKTA